MLISHLVVHRRVRSGQNKNFNSNLNVLRNGRRKAKSKFYCTNFLQNFSQISQNHTSNCLISIKVGMDVFKVRGNHLLKFNFNAKMSITSRFINSVTIGRFGPPTVDNNNIADSWRSITDDMVPMDPESTSVDIMTDSELGSEDRMQLAFYTSFGYIAGGFNIYFSSIPQYWIQYCYSSSKTNFPTDLPVARVKIWRITLTKTFGIRLQIHCNNVEVLNILLSDTTCGRSDWSIYWNRKIWKMRFTTSDVFTAADSYRLVSSTGEFLWTANC